MTQPTSETKSPIPDLPWWLWIVIGPVVFLCIPFIMCFSFVILGLMKLVGASKETQEQAIPYSGLIIVPFIMVFLALSFLGGSIRTGSSRRPNSTPRRYDNKSIDELYRSQFSSDEERLEFEAWNKGNRELYRDAPIGGTRRGDAY